MVPTAPSIGRVVVPLDGSAFAERALPPARWLATRLRVPVEAIHVPADGDDDHEVGRRLAELASTGTVDEWRVIPGDDAVDVLGAAVGFGDSVLACLATHGRDRSAAFVGSVARGVAGAVPSPVVLVGPGAEVASEVDAPVVVALEGSDDDEDLGVVGSSWAAALGQRLVLVTVVVDAPEPVVPGARHAMSEREARAHLAGLVARVPTPPLGVGTQVVTDPFGLRDGLASFARRCHASLVVVGGRRDRRLRRLLLGDHCAEVVHASPAPALVVPVGLGG